MDGDSCGGVLSFLSGSEFRKNLYSITVRPYIRLVGGPLVRRDTGSGTEIGQRRRNPGDGVGVSAEAGN